MAYHNGASCEVVEAFLESAQGVYVNVVGGLVEQKHVALFFQCHGQMQTVALAAGEHAHFLFLVGAGEVEAREICAGVYVAASHAEAFHAF